MSTKTDTPDHIKRAVANLYEYYKDNPVVSNERKPFPRWGKGLHRDTVNYIDKTKGI